MGQFLFTNWELNPFKATCQSEYDKDRKKATKYFSSIELNSPNPKRSRGLDKISETNLVCIDFRNNIYRFRREPESSLYSKLIYKYFIYLFTKNCRFRERQQDICVVGRGIEMDGITKPKGLCSIFSFSDSMTAISDYNLQLKSLTTISDYNL